MNLEPTQTVLDVPDAPAVTFEPEPLAAVVCNQRAYLVHQAVANEIAILKTRQEELVSVLRECLPALDAPSTRWELGKAREVIAKT